MLPFLGGLGGLGGIGGFLSIYGILFVINLVIQLVSGNLGEALGGFDLFGNLFGVAQPQ